MLATQRLYYVDHAKTILCWPRKDYIMLATQRLYDVGHAKNILCCKWKMYISCWQRRYYCGIDTIRSSGLHSFNDKRNRKRTGQDPSYFYHLMIEGRRILSYLSRNTLPDTKSSGPNTEFHSGIYSTSSGIPSGRIYQRHLTSVSKILATGFS